jgi:nitrous oxidase accessory protein NosD
MLATLFRRLLPVSCALSLASFASIAAAANLCVNPHGSHGCYKKIQTAVNAASKNDVIDIAAGIYSEDVTIGIPLSLKGGDGSVIDATGKANGIFVDGLSNPGLKGVTISGLTVINANFEGILVVSASDVTISNSNILDNDKTPGLNFTGGTEGCPGQPAFETDETGDCGGAIHLIGVVNSVISGNQISGNADGILISDET